MTPENPTADRLKALRERAGLSVRAMAREVGKSPSGYLHYETPSRFKDEFLPLREAEAVAAALEPHGIKRSEVMALAGIESDTRPMRQQSDLVPVYNVAASAGDGTVVYDEHAVASLAFPPGYLTRITTANPRDLAIISVKGDSMLPTLADDDVVMLDVSKRDLSYDGLFVIRDNGDSLLVKRIGRASRNGYVTIISDNRNIYPSVERALSEIEVVGKVIWSGGKV